METFPASLALCARNSQVTGEFPSQRPVTRSFDIFFELRLNKLLSKQWWGRWFETPWHSLWRHGNDFTTFVCNIINAQSRGLGWERIRIAFLSRSDIKMIWHFDVVDLPGLNGTVSNHLLICTRYKMLSKIPNYFWHGLICIHNDTLVTFAM